MPRLLGAEQAIQVAYAEDREGRLAVDGEQARIAVAYINDQLDQGRPVVVGVSYDDDAINIDKLTEHFVTIYQRGYDEEGRVFYGFKDPGARGRSGRLYVDRDTGNLFKEGDLKRPFVESADYEMTQVRTWDR